MNSIISAPRILPKRLLAFISLHYRSRISKKSWNFFFSRGKISSEKNCWLKYQSSTLMTADSIYFSTTSVNQRNFKSARKRDNSQVSWSEGMSLFFSKVEFLKINCHFLNFETKLRELSPK